METESGPQKALSESPDSGLKLDTRGSQQNGNLRDWVDTASSDGRPITN